MPRPAFVTSGNTRIASAVGPSALASGAVAYKVCRADCDLLVSSAAAVFPFSCERDVGATPVRAAIMTIAPAKAVTFIFVLLALPAAAFVSRRSRVRGVVERLLEIAGRYVEHAGSCASRPSAFSTPTSTVAQQHTPATSRAGEKSRRVSGST